MEHVKGNAYHNRWGYGCRHKYKKYDWKQNIFIAGRKLKNNCIECDEPISKGQKYVRYHYHISIDHTQYEDYHLECFPKGDETKSRRL